MKAHLVPFFSNRGPIFCPYLYVKYATKKNRNPLVMVHMIINENILKLINPLDIVKSLKGSGVKPAVTSIPNHDIKPPFEENLSFKKLGSS